MSAPKMTKKEQDAYGEALRRIDNRRRSRIGERSLDLSDLGLTVVPEEIGQLRTLRELDLSHNQLSSLPTAIGGIRALKWLDLGHNSFSAIPQVIWRLTGLAALDFSDNQIVIVPAEIGQLTELTALRLDGNQITAIPREIGRLARLGRLSLNRNKLAAIPVEIGKLRGLQMLHLTDNQLTELPADVGKLKELEALYLDGNQLASLPLQLGKLAKLKGLFLHRNPGLRLPSDVLGPEWESADTPARPSAILEHYFAARTSTARPLNEVKLLMVGRGGVGKTSMVEQLIRGNFDEKQQSTTGIALQDWKLMCGRGEAVTVHVWDFAGQVIAHATHQFFFSARSVYVLVLSGREDIQREDAEYWLRLIRAFGSHAITGYTEPVTSKVLVALNKSDEAPVRLDREALREKYPFIADFIETDCKSGRGIELFKAKLAEIIGADEGVKGKVGAEFFATKEALRQRWHEGKANHMDYVEYEKVCTVCGVKDQKQQKNFAEMLHRLGLALNYGDDPRIRDTTVLNPHWVTDGIYLLLRKAPNSRAELTLEAACKQLPNEELRRVLFLIRLMQKYDLAFPLREEEETWLVPQALADSQPVLGAEWHGIATRLRWTYVALPEGLVPRFITRTHMLSEGQPRWLNGAILVLSEARAVVRADATDRVITATVIGPAEASQQLAGTIQAEMRLINADIRGLDPREELQMQRNPAIWLPVRGLEKAEKQGTPSIDMLAPDGVVQVNATDENNRLTNEDARTEVWKPRVFVSYSHKDDAAKDKLLLKLRVLKTAGLVDFWIDCDLTAGAEWNLGIREELEKMDVFVLLVSDNSLTSEYINHVEIKRALERRKEGTAEVVPIILERCHWKSCCVFNDLVALPKDGKPIRDFKPQSNGWHDTSEHLEILFNKLKRQHSGERRVRDKRRKGIGKLPIWASF